MVCLLELVLLLPPCRCVVAVIEAAASKLSFKISLGGRHLTLLCENQVNFIFILSTLAGLAVLLSYLEVCVHVHGVQLVLGHSEEELLVLFLAKGGADNHFQGLLYYFEFDWVIPPLVFSSQLLRIVQKWPVQNRVLEVVLGVFVRMKISCVLSPPISMTYWTKQSFV